MRCSRDGVSRGTGDLPFERPQLQPCASNQPPGASPNAFVARFYFPPAPSHETSASRCRATRLGSAKSKCEVPASVMSEPSW